MTGPGGWEGKGRNQRDIREHNSATILRLVRDHGPVSRSEIASRTGLTKATVSVLVREFEAMGILVPAAAGQDPAGKPGISELTPAGASATGPGPKPRLLEFNANVRYVIGVDLSDVRFEAALVNLRGELYGAPVFGELRKSKSENKSDLLAQIFAAIDQLYAVAIDRGLKLGGIGVAISGMVDYRRGIVHRSTVFNIEDLPLQAELEKRYSLPARIDGDVNVRLLAEQGEDERDWSKLSVVYYYVGSGVGAGIFSEGQIYRGASGLTGEVGHITVVPNGDGPLCACGRRGCLEAVGALPALVRRAAELGFRPQCAPEHLRGEFTHSDVIAAAEAGDPVAKRACEEVADYLAKGLGVLVNILNPDLLIVGGGIAFYPGYFYPLLRVGVNRYALAPASQQAELRFARVLHHAGVIGSVGLLMPVILRNLTPSARVSG